MGRAFQLESTWNFMPFAEVECDSRIHRPLMVASGASNYSGVDKLLFLNVKFYGTVSALMAVII